MRIFEKILIFLFSLIIVICGVFSIYIAFVGVDPVLNWVYDEFATTGFAWEFLVAGIITVLVGFIIMLCVAFRRSAVKAKDPGSIETVAAGGTVKLSTAAINAIVNETAKRLDGVGSINTSYVDSPNGVIVSARISLAADTSVIALSDKLKVQIKKNLEELGGIKVAEVKLLVEDVTINSKTQLASDRVDGLEPEVVVETESSAS